MKKDLIFIFIGCLLFLGSVTLAEAQRDQSIKVRLGEAERASSSGIRVNFVSVVEDSRCPEDAQCILAGRVVIEVMIEADSGEPVSHQFSSEDEKKSIVVGNYRVHLSSVSPNPEHGSKTGKGKDEGYSAVFRFERLPRPSAEVNAANCYRTNGFVK